jgi:hypothetical protein
VAWEGEGNPHAFVCVGMILVALQGPAGRLQDLMKGWQWTSLLQDPARGWQWTIHSSGTLDGTLDSENSGRGCWRQQ